MRRTKEEAEKTRESILDAAVNLFARQGYANATLDEVATGAGVTKGAIYWHFDNKADLYRMVVEREQGRVSKLIESIMGEDIQPFRKARKIAYAVLDNFYDTRQFRDFIELTWYKSSPQMFDESTAAKSLFVHAFIDDIAKLLAAAVTSGEIRRETDHRNAALHYACLINGIYRLYLVAPAHAGSKQDAKDMFDTFFEFLAAEAETNNHNEY